MLKITQLKQRSVATRRVEPAWSKDTQSVIREPNEVKCKLFITDKEYRSQSK